MSQKPGEEFSGKQRQEPASRCKCCVEVGLKRFRTAAGFKTRKVERHERDAPFTAMPNFEWDSLSESTQRICKRYEEHGLSEDVRRDLALAGGTEREFQTLQEAFNRVTHRTREPRSPALQLYKAMTSVIASLEADVAEGEAESGTAESDVMMAKIPAFKKTKTENEETARGTLALQQAEQAKPYVLPAQWADLKKEYDMRCGLQVDWNTICRETNASAACYGYLAGQLTNNIQATAQDKAAQLRLAVRDGWKQYRAKGKPEQASSNPSSVKETQPVTKKAKKTQEIQRTGGNAGYEHSYGNWTYWHVNCEAIPKSKRFGWSDRSDVKQPLCMACNTRFYTEENAEPMRMLDHAKYHPMYCHGKCRAVLQRSEFRSGMLKNGGKQKLCATCQG